MKHANYTIKETPESVTLTDIGPWGEHLSITNDAEHVVEKIAPTLAGRSLFYIDTEGLKDEIEVADGRFVGFVPGPNGFVPGPQ